jgi:hypothetical protein
MLEAHLKLSGTISLQLDWCPNRLDQASLQVHEICVATTGGSCMQSIESQAVQSAHITSLSVVLLPLPVLLL